MTGIHPDWRVSASAATRTGPLHQQNEDAHAVLEAAGLFALSDGIGGLAEGAVASRAVVELLVRAVKPGAVLDARVEQARDALFRTNAALFQAGAETMRPMGATVVLAILGEGCAVCLWAGDSRAYLARENTLHQVTRDHAIFARVSQGTAPRSMVTRAIGPEETVDVDCAIVDLLPGDTLLLCSDGVFNAVTETRLGELIATTSPASAEQVVAEAVACGTRDDATAVVVRICPEEEMHVAHG